MCWYVWIIQRLRKVQNYSQHQRLNSQNISMKFLQLKFKMIQTELVKFKRENPGSIIVTNDGFPGWISGKETVPEITTADWQKEKKERKEFGFKEGKFTRHEKTTNLPKKRNFLTSKKPRKS